MGIYDYWVHARTHKQAKNTQSSGQMEFLYLLIMVAAKAALPYRTEISMIYIVVTVPQQKSNADPLGMEHN